MCFGGVHSVCGSGVAEAAPAFRFEPGHAIVVMVWCVSRTAVWRLQNRYIQYFTQVLDGVRPRGSALVLTRVILHGVPDLSGIPACVKVLL